MSAHSAPASLLVLMAYAFGERPVWRQEGEHIISLLGGAGAALGGRPDPAPHSRNPPAFGPCCPASRGGPRQPRPGVSPGCTRVRERRLGRVFTGSSRRTPWRRRRRPTMHTSFSAQLAQLQLGHAVIDCRDAAPVELPEPEAVEQTLAAIWSDLFALFPGTALEDDSEEIAWGLVNLFHRAAAKRSAQVDRATDEIRCLLASADGSEVHSSELERQVDRARSAELAMTGLEAFREAAAALYLNETGTSWRPAAGSRLNHGAALTSAVVEGRDYLRARAESRRRGDAG